MPESTTPPEVQHSLPRVIEIPVSSCCGEVFAGEECGCEPGAMSDLPPLLFDFRQPAVVAS